MTPVRLRSDWGYPCDFCGRGPQRGKLKNQENIDSTTDVDFHEPECCFSFTKSIWKAMGTSQ